MENVLRESKKKLFRELVESWFIKGETAYISLEIIALHLIEFGK